MSLDTESYICCRSHKVSCYKKVWDWRHFSLFVDDMKRLCMLHVTVECRDVQIVFKGNILLLLVENLGSHSVGGFKQAFTAYHFCWSCLAAQDQSQNHFIHILSV